MSLKRQRNLWRTGFLTVTAGAIIMECWAAWDGNHQTDPWTDLITTYVPWQAAVAVFGALLLWVPLHFVVAYRRRMKAKSTTAEVESTALTGRAMLESMPHDLLVKLRDSGSLLPEDAVIADQIINERAGQGTLF